MPKMPKVFIEKINKTKHVKASTMQQLIASLKLNPEEVLTIRNNELVTLDTKLSEKDSFNKMYAPYCE